MNTHNENFPWGNERVFITNELATVKMLYIEKGESLSLQYHLKRDEFWRIISGTPEVIIGDQTRQTAEGDEFSIPRLTKHRIIATTTDVVVLEIATGEFDQDDIVRLEDMYGRA